MAELTYNPRIFDAPDLEAARRIILTGDRERGTDDRWAAETPYLAGLAAEALGAAPGRLVLDYGCGVGRMAKALIETTGCRVLGVDLSQDMRALAPGYVGSEEFSVVSLPMLVALVGAGLRADGAIAVWVLQHCPTPGQDVDLVRRALKPDARLFVANTVHRCVPTLEQRWVDDGLDLRALLRRAFRVVDEGALDPAQVGAPTAAASFRATYAAR